MFLKIKIWNTKCIFKNESIYPFRKYEKLYLFLQSFVEGFFILFILQSMFHFVDLFFSNSSCCE